MSASPKSTCTGVPVGVLDVFCLIISLYLPAICLFVECAMDVPIPWAIGATILSFVSSVVVSYPLRIMAERSDHKNPNAVDICFTYWVLSFCAAAYKWDLWLPSSDSGILTFATYMFYVFVFYMAELLFHRFVSALDPRLGSFEEVHTFLWDTVDVLREFLADISKIWKER
ncbi:hypothetical protein BD410DRAFT_789560 [Rickenella mellea]|uniref:Uncharacterized protein n=1 Tax=Rickenella mellea TaxID=50990 RepID=A0A4Y7Q224_9AGAM|nr:hypothetical protein BD410DRAFT_789560 [Rickenella mellea]